MERADARDPWLCDRWSEENRVKCWRTQARCNSERPHSTPDTNTDSGDRLHYTHHSTRNALGKIDVAFAVEESYAVCLATSCRRLCDGVVKFGWTRFPQRMDAFVLGTCPSSVFSCLHEVRPYRHASLLRWYEVIEYLDADTLKFVDALDPSGSRGDGHVVSSVASHVVNFFWPCRGSGQVSLSPSACRVSFKNSEPWASCSSSWACLVLRLWRLMRPFASMPVLEASRYVWGLWVSLETWCVWSSANDVTTRLAGGTLRGGATIYWWRVVSLVALCRVRGVHFVRRVAA